MDTDAFTDSLLGPLYDGGAEIGSLAVDVAFKGRDRRRSMIVATPSSDAATVLNHDKPAYASFGYYDSSEQLVGLGE